MGFPVSSHIFAHIRASRRARGLSTAQLKQIVSYVDRSPTLTALLRDFESEGGHLEYSDADINFFWILDTKPVVYVSPENYRNSSALVDDADIDGLTGVLAHEMSHFVSYFKEGLNPNNLPSCDDAASAGVHDEARAYAQEYLIQTEINATPGPQIEWMKEGQLEAIDEELALSPATLAGEALHDAATGALLDWAANWTGPDEDAGGYFEFYRNDWLKVANQPVEEIETHSVRIIRDGVGNIARMEFKRAGAPAVMVATRDPGTGTFA